MKVGIRSIDHIVYCVDDLDRAMADFEKRLGVAPVFGGYHTTQGTKNALLNLGRQCYLEILAIDYKNVAITGPRWMGIDLLSSPQITRWALKSTDLESDSQVIRSHNPSLGRIEGGQRKTTNGDMLRWGISMPLSEPEIDVIPFMTDWSESSAHPTDSLDEQCKLIGIELGHPNPGVIQPIMDGLDITIDAKQSDEDYIRIQIACPNGVIEI